MKAEEALDQVAYMRQLVGPTRVRVASGYGAFIVWGLVWFIGYSGAAFLDPESSKLLWGVLIPVAVLTQIFWVGRTSSKREGRAPDVLGKNLVALNLAIVLAVLGHMIMTDTFSADVGLQIPFWVGVIYILNGIFLGRSMMLIGAWIVVAAFAGHSMEGDAQHYWMAVVGGGSLLVTGLMLRRSYRALTRN